MRLEIRGHKKMESQLRLHLKKIGVRFSAPLCHINKKGKHICVSLLNKIGGGLTYEQIRDGHPTLNYNNIKSLKFVLAP